MAVPAYETSLRSATFWLKYGFGLGIILFGLAFFNTAHPYGTGAICLGFLIIGSFFLSVASVKAETKVVRYRIWFRWHTVSYSDILDCGESWVFAYIKCRGYLFPWGKIYFARGYADDSLFGWDKKIISSIRNRAGIRQ
jgi:hypothetical protein